MSIVWKTGENRKQWLHLKKVNLLPKEKKTLDHWKEYHITKKQLATALKEHLVSIKKVFVYDPHSDFNDGSYEAQQEHIGKYLMTDLQKKLTVWNDKTRKMDPL